MIFRSLPFSTRRKIVRIKDIATVVFMLGFLVAFYMAMASERASAKTDESRTETMQPSGATVTSQLNGQRILRSQGQPRLQSAIDDFLTKYPDYSIVSVSVSESPAQEIVVFSPKPVAQ